jgi:hypothetical protein
MAESQAASRIFIADEWAPPNGREYLAHTRRVYGGGTVPWASGLEERASATHNSAVAVRSLRSKFGHAGNGSDFDQLVV